MQLHQHEQVQALKLQADLLSAVPLVVLFTSGQFFGSQSPLGYPGTDR